MSTIASPRSPKNRGSTTTATSDASASMKLSTAESTPTCSAAADVEPRTLLLRDLHFTRPDGSACFGAKGSRAAAAAWAALSPRVVAEKDAECRAAAKAAQQRSGRPAAEFKGLPKPVSSFHHEGLRAALLRTDWSTEAAQLAVDWSSPEMRCEFTVGNEVLCTGSLPVQVVVDGRPRRVVGPWEEVLWESDGNVDYLELEIALDGGVRLQRHFVLTRRDGVLVVADALLSPQAANLACELRMPTIDVAKFVPEAETRDGLLVVGKRKVAVLPPALPEWRSERRVGELTKSHDSLVLAQSAEQAAATFVPLCFVFDSARARRERTWRQLTIGENLQLQPADRAVGFRLQVAREHWLMYRSLTGRANRTLFSVNLQTNFLFARFKADGEVETLIEVED